MCYSEWEERVSCFRTIDVRGIQGNFFQGIKNQAMKIPEGEGIEIIQSFDPIPLYEVMEGLGYEHHTEKKGGCGISRLFLPPGSEAGGKGHSDASSRTYQYASD